jgi:hypothetical protein
MNTYRPQPKDTIGWETKIEVMRGTLKEVKDMSIMFLEWNTNLFV